MAMADSEPAPKSDAAVPLWPAIAAVAAGLLAVRVGVLLFSDLTLHGDEAQYWTWSRSFEWGYYSKPPLIAWVIGAATAVCGDAAACVRLPATLFHIGSGLILTLLARDLFGARTALWCGVAWLTLPAVSYSSLIMSTDTILLFLWSVALLAYARILAGGGWRWVLLLAIAFGLGLNAKYAMAYFLLSAVIHGLAFRQVGLSALPRLLAGFALGAAMILPNVLWNASNGWATMEHTADNAHWQGIVLHFDEVWEFLSAQFGVFGPIFFASLILILLRRPRGDGALSDPAKFLISFSVPVLAVISIQALLSRANANWAATAYPAATLLVTAYLLSGPVRIRWLKGSVGVHLAAALVLYVGVLQPDRTAEIAGRDPFEDLSGWQEIADQVESLAAARGIETILMDNRLMIATLAYTMRDSDLSIRAWNHDAKIDHHYEMAWLYDRARDGNVVLLITPHGVEPYEAAFAGVEALDDLIRVDRAGEEHILHARVLTGETP